MTADEFDEVMRLKEAIAKCKRRLDDIKSHIEYSRVSERCSIRLGGDHWMTVTKTTADEIIAKEKYIFTNLLNKYQREFDRL